MITNLRVDLRLQLYCVFLVPPSSVQLQAGNLTIRAGGLVTVVEDRVETLVCTTRNSNPAPRIAWMLGKMSDGELSTNLCKVSQCQLVALRIYDSRCLLNKVKAVGALSSIQAL